MDEKTAKALRDPFPLELIGKRPQPTCRDCSKAPNRVCDSHRKRECPECGQYMTTAHIHLDFVGHADITDRFLQVDPDWSWEPFALDERGLPVFDQFGGMWIRLTISGVTRIGYGDSAGKTGPNAVKEAIGDALRNAGMRFGAGLDMWRTLVESEPEPQRQAAAPAPPPVEQRTDHDWLRDVERRIQVAEQPEGLTTLANEVRAKVLAGRCEAVHEAHLFSLGRKREQEIAAHSTAPAAAQPQLQPTPQPSVRGGEPVDENGFEARLKAAETLAELDRLKADVMAAFKAQKLDPTAGNSLLRSIKARAYEMEEAA